MGDLVQQPLQIVVIGGGAAGFMGAITSAASYPHAQVTLLEAGRQVLTKVRISGGGRCNVTHSCFDPALLVQNYPRGGKALRGSFSRFQPRDTLQWFQQRGVHLKTESDGRIFPTSDDSATIVNCLLDAADQAQVRIRTGAAITQISQASIGKFELQTTTGELLHADRILLTTGSNPAGYRLAQQLGHQIEPPVPSLFTFTIRDPQLLDLAGISLPEVDLQLTTPDGSRWQQSGPLMITHWGFSGPAVLKLSAWAARSLHQHHYQAPLRVNWLPSTNPEKLRQELLDLKIQQPRKTLGSFCPFPLPQRLWKALLMQSSLDGDLHWSDLPHKSLPQLISQLTGSVYAIQGKGAFKEEFVTCGGIRLKEVDFKTMQSRCCPHLYLAGEILDIDGVTGGFNFQSAWTTGWLAGQAIGSD